MLAPGEDPLKNPNFFNEIRFPLLCSPKLDGIRCIIKDGCAMSRSFKPIPSMQVQSRYSEYADLDGELIVGNETDFDVYNRTQSFVMSDNKPHIDLKYRVFDFTHHEMEDATFTSRLKFAKEMIEIYNKDFGKNSVSIVEHTLCDNIDDLLKFETKMLSQGYEGIMMRDPLGRYKHGRGTFKEGLIYKLKRFQDDEAIVTGFVEQMLNQNEEKRDALGYTERSTSKAGLVPADTLGKFLVDYNGIELEVSCGILTHPERYHVWIHQDLFKGQILKFRHFTHGVKDLPRFPRFVGWRNKIDTGTK